MNEYSFIKFGISDDSCELQLPVATIGNFSFFVDDDTFTNVALLTNESVYVRDISYTKSGNWVNLNAEDISDQICFRIGLLYESIYFTSNLLRYLEEKGENTRIKYLCYEPQFGFDYSISGSYNQLMLPIIIKNPQFPQDDKVYIDGNGVRRLISSKIDKEFDLETEYMPEEWHEKLVVALGHDEIYFDGVRLQKSAPYEIDYEEYDELPCGTRLYKASAKMTKNTTIRNNNC